MVIDWDMLWRLCLAAFCGGLIGLERERVAKAAGLRTHMIVSIGAALIMVVSIESAQGKEGADPTRIAAQVVSGIGFLGAGAIIRFGMSVKGLTTAASLWTSAGIGLAAGMGYVQGAVAATLLVLIAVYVFDKIEHRFIVGRARKQLVVHGKDSADLLSRLEKILKKQGVKVIRVGLQKNLADKKVELTFLTDTPDTLDLNALTKEIGEIKEVQSIDID